MTTRSRASYVYVDSDASLAGLVARMKDAARIALDTEADSLHHYYEKVCLIQLTLDGRNYVVDPLCGLDLTRFLSTLAAKPLILHSAEYDLRMLLASLGFRPKSEVFDTMLAAQLLGYEEFSLGALVDRFFGATLDQRGQKSNWARRPLSPEQLHYAVDDTRYLEPLAEKLEALLRDLGRCDWHREACERMIRATARRNDPDPEDAWRIKGLRYFKPQELAFVREIWHWRENEASAADRPPFKIMVNQQILELAVWALSHPSASLADGPKLPRDCRGRRLAALERAIRKAHDLPASDWPQPRKPKGRRPEPPPAIDALRDECLRVATDLGIDPAVLAPRAVLQAIARRRPQTLDDLMACGPLMRWQAELLQPGFRRIWAAASPH